MDKMNLSNGAYIVSRKYSIKDIEFRCQFCETKFVVSPLLCEAFPATNTESPYDVVFVTYRHKCPVCGIKCDKDIHKIALIEESCD